MSKPHGSIWAFGTLLEGTSAVLRNGPTRTKTILFINSEPLDESIGHVA